MRTPERGGGDNDGTSGTLSTIMSQYYWSSLLTSHKHVVAEVQIELWSVKSEPKCYNEMSISSLHLRSTAITDEQKLWKERAPIYAYGFSTNYFLYTIS